MAGGVLFARLMFTELGGMAVWPFLGGATSWIVLDKREWGRSELRLASSIQLGHATWIVAAFLVARPGAEYLIDPALLVGGAVWLVAHPSVWPAVALTAVHVASVTLGIVVTPSDQLSPLEQKGLVVHLLLRAVSIAAMAIGLWQMRRAGSTRDSRLRQAKS